MKVMLPLVLATLLAGPPLAAQSPAPSAAAVQAASAQATAAKAQVGVDEKLGAQVPMDLVLNDEDGKPVKLGSLIDKPTVLTLNYFRCAGICTPLLNGMVDVINQTKSQPGQDFKVITVSFDPTDTPDVARMKQGNYLKEITRPFAPASWRFLTGPAAATKALCDAVGFKFQAQGDGFIHSGVILVLSPQGKVTRYMYGISFLPADLQMAVLEAARGETRPTVNHLLQFCFSQSTNGQGYVFAVTKVVAIVTFLLAGGFLAWLFLRRKRPGSVPKA
jgi:protein SCO1/2